MHEESQKLTFYCILSNVIWHLGIEQNFSNIVMFTFTGIIGGKFLERGRVKKSNQPSFSTELSEYYSAQDLFVGTVVVFNSHRFILIDADDYAYCYMERHADEVR